MSSFQEAIDPEEEKIRDLEDDFNDGKPFEYDNETFKNLFMQANAMGYPRSVALEAYQGNLFSEISHSLCTKKLRRFFPLQMVLKKN